jgi:hypothetical protein
MVDPCSMVIRCTFSIYIYLIITSIENSHGIGIEKLDLLFDFI